MSIYSALSRTTTPEWEPSPVVRGDITWNGDIAHCPQYGDVYFSKDGGPGQAEHVFVRGNQLVQRWSSDRHAGPTNFAIAELGLGTATNFLCTWNIWNHCRRPGAKLFYFAFEKHPLEAESLKKIHRDSDFPPKLLENLLEKWPPLFPGFHPLFFPQSGLTLICAWGDCREYLPQLQTKIDAWYLDGFAPNLNPEIFNADIYRLIAQKSVDGATLATYSVSSSVVHGLTEAGFDVEKAPGFGSKRQMLHARLGENASTGTKSHQGTVAIIGGGLAGCLTARAFAARGWKPTLFEKEANLATKASGNVRAAIMPHLSAKIDLLTRFSWISVILADQLYSDSKSYCPSGVLRLASSKRLQNLVDNLAKTGLSPEVVEVLTPELAAEVSGISLHASGLHFKVGGHVCPPQLCEELKSCFEFRPNSTVNPLELLDQFDGLVMCQAYEAGELFEDLPLEPVRGQVSKIQNCSELQKLKLPVCFDGYLVPIDSAETLLGATFSHADNDEQTRDADNQDMLQRLSKWVALAEPPALGDSRVAFRSSTPDRLPVVGRAQGLELKSSLTLPQSHQVPSRDSQSNDFKAQLDFSRVFLNLGHAARGASSCAFAAELIAAQASEEPLWAERDLCEILRPNRFKERRFRERAAKRE